MEEKLIRVFWIACCWSWQVLTVAKCTGNNVGGVSVVVTTTTTTTTTSCIGSWWKLSI